LKVLNILSGAFFLISSTCLLCIPFINFKEGFTITTYIFAGLFWFGLLVGIVLQILIAFACKGIPVKKSGKKVLRVIGIVFLALLVATIPGVVFFNSNRFILPINLLAVLMAAEAYCVVTHIKKLKSIRK